MVDLIIGRAEWAEQVRVGIGSNAFEGKYGYRFQEHPAEESSHSI